MVTLTTTSVLSVLLSTSLLLPSAAALARPKPKATDLTQLIEDAKLAFEVQDYDTVIRLLDEASLTPELDTHRDQARALEMLGASYWFTAAFPSARIVFGLLLRRTPFHQLDQFVYPAELIMFFNQRRRELIDASLIPGRPSETISPITQTLLVREYTHNQTPTFTYLLPLGLGQFANNDTGKGVAFAVFQGLGMATMAATWLGVESLKIEGTNRIHRSDRKQAELMQGIWYGGLGLFISSWAWSIIDGFAYRNKPPQLKERLELIEDGGPSTSLQLDLSPMGLSLSGHF